MFLDIEEEKLEKEFFQEILRRMENLDCGRSSGVDKGAQTTPVENETPNRGTQSEGAATDEAALDTSQANPASGEDNCPNGGMESGGASITQLQVDTEVHPVVVEPDEHTQLLLNSTSINS